MEKAIHHIYIPAVAGHCPPNDQGHSLLSFPLHLGGLGIINPLMISDAQYRTLVAVTNPLVSLLLSRNGYYTHDIMDSQHSVKAKLSSLNQQQQLNNLIEFQKSVPSALSHSIDIAQEPGASTWLSTVPLRDHDFILHKSDFRDTLCLRYGWMPALLPKSCVCVVSPLLLSMP